MKLKIFKKSAFTLIELSIVLIIIGIILASVMKGRDLIGSAQSKEVTQTFIQKWATIANTYYSKVNQVMADGEENGGIIGDEPNGYFDNISYDSGVTTNPAINLILMLQNAGIDPCELVKTDIKEADADAICQSNYNPLKRNFKGEFVGKKTSNVHFYNMTLDSKSQNVILFTNISGDLAKAIDTIIDGVPDGQSGSIVGISEVAFSSTFAGTYPDDSSITAPTVTVDWRALSVDTSDVKTYYYYTLAYIMED